MVFNKITIFILLWRLLFHLAKTESSYLFGSNGMLGINVSELSDKTEAPKEVIAKSDRESTVKLLNAGFIPYFFYNGFLGQVGIIYNVYMIRPSLPRGFLLWVSLVVITTIILRVTRTQLNFGSL